MLYILHVRQRNFFSIIKQQVYYVYNVFIFVYKRMRID